MEYDSLVYSGAWRLTDFFFLSMHSNMSFGGSPEFAVLPSFFVFLEAARTRGRAGFFPAFLLPSGASNPSPP